jgi:hypothetical protein
MFLVEVIALCGMKFQQACLSVWPTDLFRNRPPSFAYSVFSSFDSTEP